MLSSETSDHFSLTIKTHRRDSLLSDCAVLFSLRRIIEQDHFSRENREGEEKKTKRGKGFSQVFRGGLAWPNKEILDKSRGVSLSLSLSRCPTFARGRVSRIIPARSVRSVIPLFVSLYASLRLSQNRHSPLESLRLGGGGLHLAN